MGSAARTDRNAALKAQVKFWREILRPPSSETRSLNEFTKKIMNGLTPSQEKVLRMRYGLSDGRPRTLEEIGQDFALTRQRIHQIVWRAHRKLRHKSRVKRVTSFFIDRGLRT